MGRWSVESQLLVKWTKSRYYVHNCQGVGGQNWVKFCPHSCWMHPIHTHVIYGGFLFIILSGTIVVTFMKILWSYKRITIYLVHNCQEFLIQNSVFRCWIFVFFLKKLKPRTSTFSLLYNHRRTADLLLASTKSHNSLIDCFFY